MIMSDPALVTKAPSAITELFPIPDMSILHEPTEAPPVFPLELLPSEISVWATLAAHSKSAPVDYVAFGLFASIAALIGNACNVSPWEGWAEPSNLWVALVGLPSSGKSPSQEALEDALNELEDEQATDYPQELETYKSQVEIAAIIEKRWKADCNTALSENKPAPPKPPEAIPPQKPLRPRLTCEDITIEELADLLVKNPRGLLQKRDELAGWLHSMGRYSGSDAERAFWLEAWSGKRFKVDRVRLEEPIIIPCIGLSILGGIQPDKLKEITTGINDGLSARFNYIWPNPVPPKRPKQSPDNRIILRTFKRVLDFPVGKHPVTIRFSEEGAALFQTYREWLVEEEKAHSGQYMAFLGKQAGTVARLALVLEVLKWAVSGITYTIAAIAPDTVQASIRISKQYLIPMARRVFSDGSKPTEARHSEALARWIVSHRPEIINAREVYRKAKIEGVNTSDAAKKAISELLATHWLMEDSAREGPTIGRGRKDYRINPRVWQLLEV